MNMLFPLAYILLTLSCATHSAYTSYLTSEPLGKRSTQKYCGRDIDEALKLICHSVYNTMFVNKRRVANRQGLESYPYQLEPNSDMDEFVVAIQNLRYPFASKAASLTMFPRERNYIREKRGVYDECCRKSCSITELASYCGAV